MSQSTELDLTRTDPIQDPQGTTVLLTERPEELDLTLEACKEMIPWIDVPANADIDPIQKGFENAIAAHKKNVDPDNDPHGYLEPRIISPVLDCLFPIRDSSVKIPNSTEVIQCCSKGSIDESGNASHEITTPPVDKPWDAPDWIAAIERVGQHWAENRQHPGPHLQEISGDSLARAHAEQAFYETGENQPVDHISEGQVFERPDDVNNFWNSQLYCPEHIFGPPDGDFTGTIIKVGKAGNYKIASRGKGMDEFARIDLMIGMYKVYANKDGSHRLVLTSSEDEISLRVKNRIRDTIRSNLYGVAYPEFYRRTLLRRGASDPAERRARNTLRDMISEAEWRRYVTSSFIMVRGESGLWYQVFAHQRIQIYENNRKLGSLCIHTEDCPPTDHVINMKLLIEFDEANFRTLGNFTPESRDLRDNPWFAPRPHRHGRDADAAFDAQLNQPDQIPDPGVTEEGVRTFQELIDSAVKSAVPIRRLNLVEIAQQTRQNLERYGVDTEQNIQVG